MTIELEVVPTVTPQLVLEVQGTNDLAIRIDADPPDLALQITGTSDLAIAIQAEPESPLLVVGLYGGPPGKDGRQGEDGASVKGDKGDKGDKGETGAAGSGGDLNYHHVQTFSSAVWVIPHGLNKYPSLVARDTAGSLWYGEVTYDSPNQLTVSFSSPFPGDAFLN